MSSHPSANTLQESIMVELSEHADEESGVILPHERTATYDDYLKAQRRMDSKEREKRVSFQANVDESSHPPTETDEGPAEKRSSSANLRNTANLLKTLSFRQRGSTSDDAAAWESMVQELDIKLKKLDADGHFKDTGGLKIPWYAPPLQRQRWGDEHVLPIVNHGTLFFDLFFVGAIVNLVDMVLSSVTGMNDDSEDRLRLMFYFLGTFGPVFASWERGVYYQSRYLVADYAHQGFELLRFFAVAASVLFIRPFQELRDPQGSASVFLLVVAFLFEALMQLALDLEVYFRAQGDREAIQNHTWASMKKGTIPMCVTYLTSTTIAAIFYFGSFDEPLNSGAIWNVTDLPLTLTAAGYLWNLFMQILGALHKPKGVADIRESLVPYNIDFVISRYSDWFLLLLGEVVMAMVETTAFARNYTVTLMGSLILIVMFALKFESEPDNPHGHALWRNTRNANAFRLLTELMSVGMFALSVTFKVLEAGDLFGVSERAAVSALSISLAWVLIALELTLVTHKGLMRMWARLFRSNGNNTKTSIYWPLACITLLKVVLLIFLFALPAWEADPNRAIVFAFFVVLLVAISRVVGWAFVFREDEIKEMLSTAKQKIKSKRSHQSSPDDDDSFSELENLSTVDEETGSVVSARSFRRQQSDTYNNMFDAVIFTDFEGSIISANSVALAMFRYETKSDMIGQNISILVGGGHAKHHSKYMKDFRDRGKVSARLGKQRKLKARRSDGTEFRCLIGIRLAGNGKHLIGFIRDMEGFAEVDDDLLFPGFEAKTDKQLKRVLDDKSFDSIAVIDLEGTIVGVNRTFVKEFRYDSKEEVLGLDIAIIMDSQHASIHKKMLARYKEKLKNSEPMQCKVVGKENLLPVLRKDGTGFKCIIGVNGIEDSDLLVGFIKNVESLLPRESLLQHP